MTNNFWFQSWVWALAKVNWTSAYALAQDITKSLAWLNMTLNFTLSYNETSIMKQTMPWYNSVAFVKLQYQSKQEHYTKEENTVCLLVITVPTDAIAPPGARPSAAKMMTTLEPTWSQTGRVDQHSSRASHEYTPRQVTQHWGKLRIPGGPLRTDPSYVCANHSTSP